MSNIFTFILCSRTRSLFLDKGIEDEKFEFLPRPIPPNVLLRRVKEVFNPNHAIQLAISDITR